MQRITFEGCTCIVAAPEDIEQLERELTAAKEEDAQLRKLVESEGSAKERANDIIALLRKRVEAADGLAEAAADALRHTINTPTYPDGPCMNKEYRDDLRTTLAAYRATEGKK